MWTEKREAELQRTLQKWYAIVCNWPDSWSCKSELLARDTASDGLEMLGDYLTGRAPSTLADVCKQPYFHAEHVESARLFLADV